jgi:hypothetical protein
MEIPPPVLEVLPVIMSQWLGIMRFACSPITIIGALTS